LSKNRVVRILFGPKRDEVTGVWRKLHNGELNYLYPSRNIASLIKSRRMKWERHVTCMEESRDIYKVSVGKSEGKRPYGRPRPSWEDNIRKWDVGVMTGWRWLRIGTTGGHC
jgi:hypothetical protein